MRAVESEVKNWPAEELGSRLIVFAVAEDGGSFVTNLGKTDFAHDVIRRAWADGEFKTPAIAVETFSDGLGSVWDVRGPPDRPELEIVRFQ